MSGRAGARDGGPFGLDCSLSSSSSSSFPAGLSGDWGSLSGDDDVVLGFGFPSRIRKAACVTRSWSSTGSSEKI